MAEVEDLDTTTSKRAVVGSIDAQALYPSLRIKETAAICGEAVRESNITFTGIDYRTAMIFLAISMTEEEKRETGMDKYLPTKPPTRGRKTTLATPEITGDRHEREYKESKWSETIGLTPSQEKEVLGKVIEISIRLVMTNHVYRFDQDIYRQREGGAIGSRLTGAAARLVTDWWMDRLVEGLEDDGITIMMIRKYVDDINFIIEDPQPEAAWCQGSCRSERARGKLARKVRMGQRERKRKRETGE